MAGRPTRAQQSGGEAEERAARFLVDQGLALVARNYRTRQGEIDLIARDGEMLVFVEVRLRTGERFGGALGSIHAAKRRRIEAAARHFLMRLGREPKCRFDVIALSEGEPVWLRGAFETT